MTLQPTQQLKLLHHFNDFTKSLCQIYVHKQHQRTNTHQLKSLPLTTTSKVYRPIKFIPKPTYSTITQQYSGHLKLEKYIETHVNDNLPLLTAQTAHNLTTTEWKTVIKSLKIGHVH